MLQRILPVIIAQTARRQGVQRGDPVSDAIVAATMAIATYDGPDHRRHVAPRLVSSALHDAFRKPQRRRAHSAECPAGLQAFGMIEAAPAELDPSVAAHRVLAAGAASGVDRRLIRVGRRLAHGDSTTAIAGDQHCTDRAIRAQRARLIARLREHLDDTWSEWWDPMTGWELASVA